jgi:hypothetical protein
MAIPKWWLTWFSSPSETSLEDISGFDDGARSGRTSGIGMQEDASIKYVFVQRDIN